MLVLVVAIFSTSLLRLEKKTHSNPDNFFFRNYWNFEFLPLIFKINVLHKGLILVLHEQNPHSTKLVSPTISLSSSLFTECNKHDNQNHRVVLWECMIRKSETSSRGCSRLTTAKRVIDQDNQLTLLSLIADTTSEKIC